MKFLIDECLSETLATMARQAGYAESSHIRWLGHGGRKDWTLKSIIVDGDWTFVTKNSVDFRGPASRPGSKGQYAVIELHAGLICLNSFESMPLGTQKGLFHIALTELAVDNALINEGMDVNLNEDQTVDIIRYPLPPP